MRRNQLLITLLTTFLLYSKVSGEEIAKTSAPSKLVFKEKIASLESSIAGTIFQEGLRHLRKNEYSAGAKLIKQASDLGYPAAQYMLGVCYANGLGVPKDNLQAAKWFQTAAESGQMQAEYDLGLAYKDGRGVEKNDAKAFDWLMKAAKQDFAPAQTYIAVYYALGKDGSINLNEALFWYRKAAKGGERFAQYRLGMMYYEGRGTSIDLVRAHLWFTIHNADKVDSHVMQQLTDIELKMSAQQLESAKALEAEALNKITSLTLSDDAYRIEASEKIKSNIIFNEEPILGNPKVFAEILLTPDGKLKALSVSSDDGIPTLWADAVSHAIKKTQFAAFESISDRKLVLDFRPIVTYDSPNIF